MVESVIEYLQNCAESFPSKTAVGYRDRSVTFDELNETAKQYGASIKKALDGKTGAPVGVLCTRDILPVIEFFGVLYSGNFYVPLDPDAPAEKLESIVSDCGMSVIAGSSELSNIPEKIGFSGKYITPDCLTDEKCSVPENAGKRSPLYMVYTSGSTGKPKGVLKSHGAEISFIEAYCEEFDFTKDDIIGNQTPFFFDAAAKDIYLMVKMGITLEIIPSEYFPLPPELINYLNLKKITFASWVPTVLSIVSQLNPFSVIKPQTLKNVFFVGEVMPMKHLNTWRKELPDIRYVNLYGQSELCGICSYYEVKGEFPDDATLPMGKPLKNCEIYLVSDGEVVKEAEKIGELYIVSDALATEYYNDPEKTANCFIEKDFGNGTVRCFKTGDLAKYDKEGDLVFASRSDFQIKHMGHRIELGEIEAVAGALPEVARCCCLYDAERKKIKLFCELSDGCEIKDVEIRSILKAKLSSYMVPGKVIVMDKLPLNPNGKIDRQKLKLL
ncbi:MAG: AMP-binding protein [Clostridia bacterium]|nr:AMP-binding protein [Clostridia bacterium]